MKTLKEYVEQRKQRDPEFAEAYEAGRPEQELHLALIRARAERGLTQEQLAARVGMRQSEIARIEGGRFNPRLDTLSRLAQGLDVEFAVSKVGVRVIPSPKATAKEKEKAAAHNR